MNHLEHELKSKILDLYEDGRYTQKELADRFKISDRTIKRWIQNKKNNENLSRKERKYESYKVRSIHVKYAIKMLEKEPTITMPNLLNKLKIKFTDCKLSPAFIISSLVVIGIFFKSSITLISEGKIFLSLKI